MERRCCHRSYCLHFHEIDLIQVRDSVWSVFDKAGFLPNLRNSILKKTGLSFRLWLHIFLASLSGWLDAFPFSDLKCGRMMAEIHQAEAEASPLEIAP